MTEFGAFLIPAIPLLLLLACLVLGRYPGCEAIVRLAERIESRRRSPRSARHRAAARRPRSHAPAGGLLLALSLSGRAPPTAV